MTEGALPVEVLLAQRTWVRRVARALTRNDVDADDLAQDAMLRALESGPREEGGVRRWFRTVLRNAARDAHRGDVRRRAREETSARPEVTGGADAAEVVAEAESARRVVEAVMELEEPYRSAVLLRWFRDLSVAEVARRTGVPLETARTRLRRGLALLRERFGRDAGGDREAWGLVLLPLLRPDGAGVPAATATAGATAGGSAAAAAALTGAIVMGVKLKVAAAVVLLAGGVWWTQRDAGPAAAPQAATAGDAAIADATSASAAKEPTAARDRAAPPAAAPVAETVPPVPPAESGFIVRGRVIDDETSEPVAGATVVLTSEFARMPERDPRTTTDRDGTFRLAGVEDGTFGDVLVRAEGWAEMVFRLAWKDPREKRAAGDAGDLRLCRGSRVAGRVVAADGTTPVPGARILLTSVHGAGAACWVNLAAEWGKTDSQGLFSLQRVPPNSRGHYTLFAVGGGAGDVGIGWTRLAPTVGRDPCTDVVVRVAKGGGAAVVVRDAAGAPRGGVRVVASPRFPPLGPDPFLGAHHDAWIMPETAGETVFVRPTGADGTARFPRLPPGSYEFVAWETGTNSWTHSWTGSVAVEEGKEATATIVLRDPGAWAVEGVVRTADGVPLAGVELTPAWGPKPQVTQADGRYRIEGLEARWTEFRFSVKREGFAPVEVQVGPDGVSKLVREDVVLEAVLPIEGKVVDRDGRPVAGAAVTFQRAVPSHLVRSGQSGPDGRFSIPDAAAGSWRPRVFPPAPWEEWVVPHDLPNVGGGDREVTIVIERVKPGKTRLVATVVDPAGAPLIPAEAMLLPAETTPRSGFSAPVHGPIDLTTGKVVVERVRTGTWRLWVRVDGQGVGVEDVTVAEGVQELKATVTVRAPGSLRGRVEMPVEGARLPFMVTILPADNAALPSWAGYRTADMIGAAKVAADGTFRFDGVVPGRYRFVAETRGAEGSVEAEVPSGGEGEAVLRLAAVGVLSLRLAAPSPSDAVVFEIAREGGPWMEVMRSGGQKGREDRHDANVAPGRVRWRVSFPATNAHGAPDVAKPAEGEIDVALGEPVVVTVPVVVE